MNQPEYVIVCPDRETLHPSGLNVEPGTFVLERTNAGEFLIQGRKLQVRQFVRPYRPAMARGIRAGDTVLFVRPGGYGDLLFCTPVFRHLAELGCRVIVACLPRFADVLTGNRDVWRVVPYPVPVSDWDGADLHVWLEGILEDGVKNQAETFTTPAVDLISAASGVEVLDKTLRYDVLPEEAAWALASYPKKDKPRVGIQVEASTENRTYSLENLQVVAGLLAQEGCEVMLFGRPGLFDGVESPIVDLTNDMLTFRQSCAVLATCDAVVAPDSSLCHVAGALGIPTVATFGPFLFQTRVSYAKSIHPVNGKADCAPCNHHGSPSEPWPRGCPGRKTGRCLALENIPPALVAAQVSYLLAQCSAERSEK